MTETTIHWRPIAPPPEPLVDVLLHQVLAGMGDDDPTLIRIGYLSRTRPGQWVDSYSCRLDGEDDILEGITHWAPLPAGPDSDSGWAA